MLRLVFVAVCFAAFAAGCGDEEPFPNLLRPAGEPVECDLEVELPLFVQYRLPEANCQPEPEKFLGCIVRDYQPWVPRDAEGGTGEYFLDDARCTTRADGAVFCVPRVDGAFLFSDEPESQRYVAAAIWLINGMKRGSLPESDIRHTITPDAERCYPDLEGS